MMSRFSFGKNWKSYVDSALNAQLIERARTDFQDLFKEINLVNARFLDVGFGQGLALCLAVEAGAKAIGIDIDCENLDALKTTSEAFALSSPPSARIISILDQSALAMLGDSFDIVHSWGVLHHTGDMALAVNNACMLVAPGGYLVCAIYNRHWTSPAWRAIKWLYNILPRIGQKSLIVTLYPVIYAAKFLVTRRNPFAMSRGMNFLHDVIDWVGGYPYEYASVDEFRRMVEARGFECVRVIPAEVPTGCNQFVFKRFSDDGTLR